MPHEPNHTHASQADWQVAANYPEALREVVRWKTLVGDNGSNGTGAVPQNDMSMGVLELDPGGYYPAHAHPAPEIYYVMSGTAEWSVGDETFLATPGMAIYHAPHMPHRMVNKGTEKLQTVWCLWAPGGQREVLAAEVVLLEEAPKPSGA